MANQDCDWIQIIDPSECVGDSLGKINSNFQNLEDALCDALSLFPPGLIVCYTGNSAPAGWLLCDGSYVSTTTYSTLYAVVGTKYGPLNAGNFKLPDMRGRVAVGAGTGVGLTTRNLATSGGAETVSLTVAQMPTHTHSLSDPGHTHVGSTASHTHTINDPGHTHPFIDPGHNHSVYYGMSAGTLTGSTSAGSQAGNLTPTPAQVTYGTNNALSATSVFQHVHSIGSFFDDNNGGIASNTVPNTFWAQGTDPGGGAVRLAAGTANYWLTNVNATTTSTPLQVTLRAAQTGITVAYNYTGITVNPAATTVDITPASTGVTTLSSGLGQGHENMQPYIVLHYIIKAR